MLPADHEVPYADTPVSTYATSWSVALMPRHAVRDVSGLMIECALIMLRLRSDFPRPERSRRDTAQFVNHPWKGCGLGDPLALVNHPICDFWLSRLAV